MDTFTIAKRIIKAEFTKDGHRTILLKNGLLYVFDFNTKTWNSADQGVLDVAIKSFLKSNLLSNEYNSASHRRSLIQAILSLLNTYQFVINEPFHADLVDENYSEKYNLFPGFAAKLTDNYLEKVQPLLDHIRNVIANGDNENYNKIIDWLKCTVADLKPQDKILNLVGEICCLSTFAKFLLRHVFGNVGTCYPEFVDVELFLFTKHEVVKKIPNISHMVVSYEKLPGAICIPCKSQIDYSLINKAYCNQETGDAFYTYLRNL